MPTRSALINVMIKAAEKAGKSLVRDFGEIEQLQVSRKGPADFVSTADLKAQKVLRAELGAARPAFGFLMEEDDGTNQLNDPMEEYDGTNQMIQNLFAQPDEDGDSDGIYDEPVLEKENK